MRFGTHALTLLALAVAAGTLGAQGKPPAQPRGQRQPQGQKQSQMQQQEQQRRQQRAQERAMLQAQDMVQRTSRIRDRAHQANQNAQQIMEQAQAQERHRYQLMAGTCQSAAQTADQVHELALRAQEMQRDQEMLRDRDMQRDMDRLRQHVQTMADQLDGSLLAMERMQKRLGQPTVSP